jgi:hypothetical protein
MRTRYWRRHGCICELRLRALGNIFGRADATGCKKSLKKRYGFRGAHTRCDFDAVICAVVAEDFEAGTNRAAFSFVGAVHEARDAGLEHCTGAHRAGFDGYVKGCAEQAVVADSVGSVAKGENFRVCGGIAMRDGAISGACDDFFVDDEDGADGDFATLGGLAGFGEGFGHEGEIDFGNFWHRGKG